MRCSFRVHNAASRPPSLSSQIQVISAAVLHLVNNRMRPETTSHCGGGCFNLGWRINRIKTFYFCLSSAHAHNAFLHRRAGLYMARHVRTLFSDLRVVFDLSGSHKSRITGTDQQLRDSNLESFGPKCGSRLTTEVASKDGRSCFMPSQILIPRKLPNFGFCSWVETSSSATCVAQPDLLHHHHLFSFLYRTAHQVTLSLTQPPRP